MTKYIFITFLTLYSIQALGQKPLIDNFLPGTVLIKYKSGGSSSGIIVADSTYMYLVTARHCLLNEDEKGKLSLVDSEAYLIYYLKDAFAGTSDTLLVNLSNALIERDLLFDGVNDIAILAIAKFDGFTTSGKPKFNYTKSAVKLSKFPPGGVGIDFCLNFENVDVGDDCLIIGYPSSLQLGSMNDYNFYRPLLRKGAIAGKDIGKGSIIVDCPSYQGNSGGPVFAISIYNKSNIGLIGIVSRSILQVEKLESKYYNDIVSINRSNSGYSVIVPIEFAKTLMKLKRVFN